MANPFEHQPNASDRPIESANQDRLGRDGFAREVARTIWSWRGRDSLVLGLSGIWGAGKSSVVNLVVEQLAAMPETKKTLVVRFNPWEWSGQDQVMQAFFATVGEALGQEDTSAKALAAAKSWRLIAVALELNKAGATGLSDMVKGLLWLFGAGAIVTSVLDWTLDLRISSGLLVVLAIGAIALPIVYERVASFARAMEAWRTAEADDLAISLPEVKQRVHDDLKALGESGVNLLVVIDDIDRLTPPQMLQVFQLVKSNADFPGLIYLLVYERDVVVESLRAAAVSRSDEYLEKIVQLQFDVPSATQSRVHRVLFEGLEQLVGVASVHRTFERPRWANVYQAGLRPLFGTVRDVNRYLNTVAVHTAALHVNGFFEVNIVDLIAIEALRVFQPSLHGRVRDSKELLTKTGIAGGLNSARDRQIREQQAAWLLQGASDDFRPHARSLLMELFPPLQAVLANTHYGRDDEWERSARICSPRHFDKYFTLSLEDNEIAVGELERVIMSAHDLSTFRSELAAFAERGRLEALLERLEAYKEQLNPVVCENIATGLFDVGDGLKEADGLFAMDPNMHLTRIIFHFTKHMDVSARSSAVRNAILRTVGLFAPLQYVSLDEKKEEKADYVSTMTDEDRAAAREHLLTRVRAMSADGSLWTHSRLPYILWRWYQWTEESAEPMSAVHGRLDRNRDSALVVLRSFTSVGKAYTAGQALPTLYPRIDYQSLREFVGSEKVIATVAGLRSGGALEPPDRDMISAMEKAARENFKGADDPLGEVLAGE